MPGSTCAPWATSADACSPCDDYDTVDTTALDNAMQVASDVLWNLTGRRWSGLCTDTVRPYNACTRRRERCCGTVPEVRLPGYPVAQDSLVVKVDGVTLADSEYRVDDGRWLVRLTDGEGWPCCQNMRLAASEEHTFEVTYSFGLEPPAGGVASAATLGCQYYLACQPEAIKDGRCRLPKRITTIARQGFNAAVLDPMTLIQEGGTGIAEVDQWVASVLFGDKRRRSTVIVAGRPRGTRRVGWSPGS